MTNQSFRSVVVSGQKYAILQASAVKQKELLLLLANRITMLSVDETSSAINKDALIVSLTTCQSDIFDTAAALVLSGCCKSGETTPVDIADFQGRIMDYFRLVAEGVSFNLGDFFTFIENVVTVVKAREPQQNPTG